MCTDARKALSNLEGLERLGFYGKYGFYEAVDFSPGRCPPGGIAVKSYMSHHMGMSLAALCNAAFGRKLTKRFMSDIVMSSARELLEERIPVGTVIRRLPK